jgi:hypothetical protein
MNIPGVARRYFPILDWGTKYISKTRAPRKLRPN